MSPRPASSRTRIAFGGGLVERLVAGDGRDADELHLRAGEREQDRDRVVVSRVAVDGGSSWPSARPVSRLHRRRSAVTVARRGGRRRSRRPRRRVGAPRSRSRPSSSETTRQAVNASPAAVPSTAVTSGGRRAARPRPRARAARLPRRRASAPTSRGFAASASSSRRLTTTSSAPRTRRALDRRRGVQEEAGRPSRHRGDRLGRDLELAEDGAAAPSPGGRAVVDARRRRR